MLTNVYAYTCGFARVSVSSALCWFTFTMWKDIEVSCVQGHNQWIRGTLGDLTGCMQGIKSDIDFQ